jgi:aspartate kinase
MLVFKFGGASVKDAIEIRKIPAILNRYNEKLFIVISAMGKTTNKLEILIEMYFNRNSNVLNQFQEIKEFHFNIVKDLFPDDDVVEDKVIRIFDALENKLKSEPTNDYDFEYDQIVHFGEMLSTTIISLYLNKVGKKNEWIDIRNVFCTNSKYRDATVNFMESSKRLSKIDISKSDVYITQGFIGSNKDGITTTLGREGSDYSGAILAYLLNADNLTVWKDVEGILTADPQWRENTIKLDTISYKEAIELAFYGAKVIHPKTIKPLQNKNIPLYVKSFLNPEEEGTVISDSELISPMESVFIRKENQVLLSIIPKDFSFVAEDNMSSIFSILAEFNIKVNLMLNSAVSFSLCLDYNKTKFESILMKLQKEFNVRYNLNLELITIRHYTKDAINEIINNRKILLEQRSRNTIQFILD